MKKKAALSFIFGIVVSTATFYFAIKNVPIKDLIEYMESIDYIWIIPSLLVGLSNFFLRVLRWQVILASTNRIGFWRLFHPLMIGFMINCVLPGRVGEIARPILLKKSDRVPFSRGLATVAAERVFDIILILGIFALVMMFVRIDPAFSIAFGEHRIDRQDIDAAGTGMITLSLTMIAVMVLLNNDTFRNAVKRSTLRMPMRFFFIGEIYRRKLVEKVFAPAVQMIENIAEGFSLAKYPKKIITCFGLSLAIWGLQALALYIMTFGCPGIALSFLEISAVLAIVCFFVALPSVPGFWGLWEAGGVFALALFGVPAKDAFGYTLATHAILMFPVIAVGIVSAIIMGVNIWHVSYGQGSPDHGKT